MKNWWLIFAMSLFIVSCRNEEVLVDIETHVVIDVGLFRL